MPAPLPKPQRITFFQPRPLALSLGSTASTRDRASTSMSWSMSRSSFWNVLRLRMYQEPSVTSGVLTSNSSKPSPAGCWDQESEVSPAWPRTPATSFSATPSAFGLSPTHRTRVSGFLSPSSNVEGSGPSGVVAAMLWSVKSSFSQSSFSFSRSSSSLFAAASGPLAGPPLCGSSMASGLFCNSSWRVGKIRTTCALSDASAARAKASLMASSPTLYKTVSRLNLLARTSFVMFSMTSIIFLALALSACTQRAMLKPMRLPPQAERRGGAISMGWAMPWP
mmetsp:Transcript_50706/g.94738  ORF Transcript_50706/g.94738 Transcript_50706/m.94738 type:complete len:280 (-) Transcript_50706:1397-2236(-)